MKGETFLFRAKKVSKVGILLVAFFFVGMASVSAQYISTDDAMTTLGTELRALNAEMQNVDVITPQLKAEFTLKMSYAKTIRTTISKGVNVENALNESEQQIRKRNLRAISLLSEAEVTAIFNEFDEMLSE